MSVFDEVLDARGEALANVTDHVTTVPSFPPQIRARWKPLADPTSVSTLVSTVMAMAEGSKSTDDASFTPRLVRLLTQSFVQFEATEAPLEERDNDDVWQPVLGDDGEPLGFDNRMAAKLRERGTAVGDGVVAVALAICGGPGGLVELGMSVAGWQSESASKVAGATEGSLAARQKTPVTAPPSAS